MSPVLSELRFATPSDLSDSSEPGSPVSPVLSELRFATPSDFSDSSEPGSPVSPALSELRFASPSGTSDSSGGNHSSVMEGSAAQSPPTRSALGGLPVTRTVPMTDHGAHAASLPEKQNSTQDAHSPNRDVSRPLPAPPTDAPLVAPIPHSDTTIGVVRNWIGDINHDGDPTAPLSDERLLNCGPAAIAVFQRLAGTSHDARASTDVSAPDDLGEATGLAIVPNSREGIAQRLVAEGPGAHTTVVVHFAGGEQHAFNAFYDGTEVHAIDGQHGTVVSWPPQLDRFGNPVQAWFMGTPFHGDRAIFAVPDRTSEGRDGVPHRSVITGAAPSRGVGRSSTAPPSPSHVTGVGAGAWAMGTVGP